MIYSDLHGLGCAGDYGAGGAHVSGRIANADAQLASLGLATTHFLHDTDNHSDQHTFVVYADGEPMGTTEPGALFDVGPFAEGGGSIEILALRPGEFPPVIRGAVLPRRCVIRWNASTESDLAGYKLYWDNGSGTVDTVTPLATITEMVAARTINALPGSGSGTGRITVGGTYRGAAGNANWRIKVTGSGTFQYDEGTGSYNGADLDFFAGQSFALPGGLRVAFLSAASLYATNDTWTFRVGPKTYFVTDELAADDYKFQLGAFDTHGNNSTLTSAITVTVDFPPDPPSEVAATWDVGTNTITLTWTDPAADADQLHIYTNYRPAGDQLDDYVFEGNPLAEVLVGLETYQFTIPGTLRGTFYFYVRARGTNGQEEDNINLIELECFDVTTAPINEPFDLTGEAGAAGVAVLSWKFDDSEGEADHFDIFQFTSEPTEAQIDAATPLDTEAFVADSTGASVSSYQYTTSAIPAQRWYVVRAVDADSASTKNTDSVAVTPDSTAPSAPTGLQGATG